MKKFSREWSSSISVRKQRKYRHNAPLHLRHRFFHSTLSKELRKEYKKRAVRVRKGDIVKVMRGSFKGKNGKVESVNLKRMKVYVEGIDYIRKDGRKVKVAFDPSNLMITELNTDDKKRLNRLRNENEGEASTAKVNKTANDAAESTEGNTEKKESRDKEEGIKKKSEDKKEGDKAEGKKEEKEIKE